MEEKKKSMTKDEMIMELMELLKTSGRPRQAAEGFDLAPLLRPFVGMISPVLGSNQCAFNWTLTVV